LYRHVVRANCMVSAGTVTGSLGGSQDSRHDVFMPESEPHAAFMTAALVLLVMPIVYAIGLAATMLLLQITPWGGMRAVMFGVAIIWGVVVMTGVLIAARRLNRPSARR
jgi:hypothetical protein